MRQNEVIDAAAMIGMLVSLELLGKLAGKAIISSKEAADVADDALLTLERFQSSFPSHQKGFEKAREHLSEFVSNLEKTTRSTPPRRRPPTLRDHRKP